MPEAPRIKICGLRDPSHAALAAELGAWAIGVVFARRSPRLVTRSEATAVCAAVPTSVARVGVFVDMAPDEIAQTADAVGLSHIQLHGDVDVAAVRASSDRPVWVGFGVASAADLATAERSPADLILLDASVPGEHGGTGQRPDWELIGARRPHRPFLLAGGLDCDNVAGAIARLDPWGVDVSSGVESARGVKDPARIAAFIAAARDAVPARSSV